ncbi:MAG: carbohydrate ABC transporter permease [Treponema sp.]|jgi:putative aldouronate transport system permease protein|nr:carbohydrate ABC transporter permease [Treponema sp.]
MMKKNRKGSIVPDIIICIVLGIGLLLILFPFYNVIIISLARYEDIAKSPIYFIPTGFTLDNFRQIFHENKIVRSMGISVINVALGTLMNLIMTTFAAYALSRKGMPFRRFMFYCCIFTMFFSGGLIPWFLVVKNLGLMNNLLSMTLPYMLSTFNIILMKNFFDAIPASLDESARIDGAGEFIVMTLIFVPLSKPIIATVGLFSAVAFWNDWWLANLFISKEELFPLALLLRKAIIDVSVPLSDVGAQFRANFRPVQARSIQAAAIIVSIVPIMMVYPFLQKHFAKGIILGAVKG